ncbi:ABC transporter ATP-binding protein [Streptomyces sp. NPDC050704]|uniref:ABC transporter ATP-binding protein n=1 Tax=Streptomyces sp. NPDC050704 TaxID=3157219 RepID=UPI0034314D8A
MIKQLFQVVGPALRRRLALQLAVLLAYSVLQGVAFVLIVPVLGRLLAGDTDAAWPWAWALAGVALATAVAYYVQQMLSFQVALAASHRLYHRLGDHVSALPLGWFSGEQVGALGQLASRGVPQVRSLLAHLLQPLCTAVVTPLTVVVAMAFLDWRLALATALGVPFMYVTFRWAMSTVARADEVADKAASEANERVVEFVRAQAVLRSTGSGERGRALLESALREQDEAARRQSAAMAPGRTSFLAVVHLAVAAVVVVGAALGLDGSLGVAELVALLVLVVRFAEPVSGLAELGGGLRASRGALTRIDAVLAARPLPEPADPGPPPADASLELREVRFSYDPGVGAGVGTSVGTDTETDARAKAVVDGVSLRLPANTTTAVVGPSGSGKTTLIRLLARFWDVDEGAVLLGGTDVRALGADGLMDHFSLVFQDVYLFDETIRENVRLGRPDASDEAIEEAARLSRVDEIVARLPQGWDTRVGEGGTALSGGERQRVSLARALLKDAPVMLLDEATSSLDPANEAAVQQTLDSLKGRRTLVVVAHRLQTVVSADRIVVLDGGRIAETGTHDELLALDGRYAEFWRERDRAHGWRLTHEADGGVPPVGAGAR